MTDSAKAIEPDLPLVTIVTPSFNQGAYIEATIRSVLEQDYPRIEYLVVDGGSTDDTLAILGRQGPEVDWTSEPDSGQGDAIRKGFGRSHGEILTWMNADDVYTPGAVSRAVAALLAAPSAVFAYGNAEVIDSAGAVIGPCDQVRPFSLDALVNQLDFIVQPATFFCRDPYLAVGGIDTGLTYCLDYDLWIRLAGQGEVAYIPDVLARIRVYPQTKTASGGLARLNEVEAMIRRHGRRTMPMDFQREMVWACWRAARAELSRGHPGATLAYLWRGGLYAARYAGNRGWRWTVSTPIRRLRRPRRV
jgi:glycosyltransferase involved in cell wall biosynthesis